jgi:hypothetical protein
LLSKIPKINDNNIECEDDDSDSIITEDNNIEIDLDGDKENVIKNFSSFRNFVNKKKILIYS